MHRFICHRLLMRTTRLASTALAISAATLAIHSFRPLVADETPTYDPIEGERSVLVTTTDALPDQEPAPESPDYRPAEADPAENRPPDPSDHDGATNPVEQADEPQDGPTDSSPLSEPDDLPAAFGETEVDAAMTPLSDATFVPDTPVFEDLPPQTATVYGGETQSLTEQDFDVDAPAIEAARLNGLQPGTTTKADLLAGWGAPKSRVHDTNAETFVYRFAPFEKIEAVLHDNVISEIAVELRERIPPETLARQLRVHKLAPVEIIDASGIAIGRAFPERGVLFTYAPDSAEPQVSHILLKPIDDELFLLRAEQESARKIGKSIADLRRVLKLSPNQATARWKLAEAYRRVGSVTEAESMANSAVELDPNDRRYRLSWAYALNELGRYPEAVREARRVARSDHANAVARAEALVLLGDLAAVSRGDVSKKAIELYNQAIQVADANAASEVPGERLAIKRVLVAAHLATAREIAQGKWRQKATVVPQWIERASALAEGAIQHDGGGLELRLAVATGGLEALASFQPMPDPTAWVEEAKKTSVALLNQMEDERSKRPIHWLTGQAYYHALRIEHARARSAYALRYGQRAITSFSQGAVGRDALAINEHLIGRLYFHIGAVHAIHLKDHTQATAWYDKAAPLLAASVPVTPLTRPSQHGDMLVSMGVSYWNTDDRDRAIELTQEGAELLKKAIKDGYAESSAMSVAYGNLATMHRKRGDDDRAIEYLELADRSATTRK